MILIGKVVYDFFCFFLIILVNYDWVLIKLNIVVFFFNFVFDSYLLSIFGINLLVFRVLL